MASSELEPTHDSAAQLVTMMDEKGQMPFAIAIAAVASVDEMSDIACVMTHVFDAQNLLPQLVINTLSREINRSMDVDTVLRGSNFVTTVLSYSFQEFGFPYLTECVDPIADELTNDGLCYQVNPRCLSPGDDIERNRMNLQRLSMNILDSLIRNKNKFPNKLRSIFRCVCHVLSENVRDRDAAQLAGGMLLFLRFINAFLANLFEDEEKVQDAFLLVSKLFQSAANGRPPKETHMKCFTDFTTSLRAKMNDFVNTLIHEGEILSGGTICSVSVLKSGGCHYLHYFLYKNKDLIVKYCSENRLAGKKILRRFTKLIAALGHVTP